MININNNNNNNDIHYYSDFLIFKKSKMSENLPFCCSSFWSVQRRIYGWHAKNQTLVNQSTLIGWQLFHRDYRRSPCKRLSRPHSVNIQMNTFVWSFSSLNSKGFFIASLLVECTYHDLGESNISGVRGECFCDRVTNRFLDNFHRLHIVEAFAPLRYRIRLRQQTLRIQFAVTHRPLYRVFGEHVCAANVNKQFKINGLVR